MPPAVIRAHLLCLADISRGTVTIYETLNLAFHQTDAQKLHLSAQRENAFTTTTTPATGACHGSVAIRPSSICINLVRTISFFCSNISPSVLLLRFQLHLLCQASSVWKTPSGSFESNFTSSPIHIHSIEALCTWPAMNTAPSSPLTLCTIIGVVQERISIISLSFN